jgi:hypothetical protein
MKRRRADRSKSATGSGSPLMPQGSGADNEGAGSGPRHLPMIFPRPIFGKIERSGNLKNALFAGTLLVPVERIELPTFGLQSSCSRP